MLQIGRLDLAPPDPAPPPLVSDPLVSGFMTVVDRLQDVIDFETDALSRHAAVDLAEVNRQKRQGMLELTRVMKGFVGRTPPEAVRDRMTVLTAALDRNQAVLDVHLAAVREIADIIAQVMRDAEWDGTYTLRAAWP